MRVAQSDRILPRRQIIHRLIGEDAGHAVEQGNIHMVAPAGLFATRERGLDADDGIKASHDVSQGHPDLLRCAGGIAGQVHDSAQTLDDEIIAGPRGVRTVLAKAADGGQLPTEMNIPDEIERRQQQRERLAEAKKVLEARAQAGYEVEKAEYDAKMQARAEKEAKNGRKLRGRPPKPPTPGPCDKDQYNFTDPESRIMKNATNSGFDQHYNVQVVVEHDSRLIVGNWLCDHTNDKQAALPTIDTVPPELGQPKKANLDTGYFSESNIAGLEERGFDPYIATGRSPHHQGWRAFFGDNLDPLPDGASVKEQMAYKLRTEIGNALYRLRKSTVEPVIGIIKEVLGFRQFSLRGLCATGGEWTLVCLAYNLKRMHTLQIG